jgi:hypothetical protein
VIAQSVEDSALSCGALSRGKSQKGLPAKAGIQQDNIFHWVPAFAGTTEMFS